MNSDFRELLQVFADHEVRYLVVGGYAAIHYSQPRYTKDLDLWIEPTMEGFTVDDMADIGFQFFVGCPPCAFDFLTSIKGLDFGSAWENRVLSDQQGIPVWYLSKADLITAKSAVAREQDIKDIEEIRRADL
jgi:predicted nucleotidyltransferase